jgi:two-component system cell cycle sensor histidine kinase/response regulator CckA
LIREMAKLAKDTFPRSIEIQTQVSNSIHPVKGNATQVHQVLLNLCVNARDAMPDGGRLSIEARNVGAGEASVLSGQTVMEPHVMISVVDTGHGMAPETMARIFEPFFTTKEIGKGTGLGLSTVMGIVKTHGGFVKVASRVGQGTAFQVYLPAAARAEKTPVGGGAAALPHGNGELILLVDDEAPILEVTRPLLESFNFRVFTAGDGVQALEVYKEHRAEIKAVVTDMMMPRMNGVQTIQELRKIDPGLKVIGVSGLGSETSLTKAGKNAANAFLRKPYTTEELLVALERLINEAAAA